MNANPLIMQALGNLGIPVCWLEYMGNAEEYIVFNDTLNAPGLYGDDGDVIDKVVLQIHHYTKTDPHGRITEIRRALRNAGFTVLETLSTREQISTGGTTVKNTTKTGFIHTVIRVNITGISEDFKEE